MEHSVLNAVGVWYYSVSTDRYLYLMRNDERHPRTWGLPGGKVDAGENLLAAIARESQEELGFMPVVSNLVPLEMFTSSDGGFVYHTFFASVAAEFVPRLNHEHVGYAWLDSGYWPRPMHPGLWNTVNFDSVQNKITTLRDQLIYHKN